MASLGKQWKQLIRTSAKPSHATVRHAMLDLPGLPLYNTAADRESPHSESQRIAFRLSAIQKSPPQYISISAHINAPYNVDTRSHFMCDQIYTAATQNL